MSFVDVDVPACGFIPVVHIPRAGAISIGSTPLRTFRVVPMPPPVLHKLVQRIREEFENAPDLRMNVSEAARFWGLDLATCERVLTELLRSGFLARGADERYTQTA